ncbi:hypothetical protein D3C80_1216640 [compost metagenome]
MVGITVLRIGPEPAQRRADINETEEIEPERHSANPHHPGQDTRNTNRMPRPKRRPYPVALEDQGYLLHQEIDNHDQRAKRQPPQQGGVPERQISADQPHSFPGRLGEIRGFRIFDRIGQMFVAVVGQMPFPVNGVG